MKKIREEKGACCGTSLLSDLYVNDRILFNKLITMQLSNFGRNNHNFNGLIKRIIEADDDASLGLLLKNSKIKINEVNISSLKKTPRCLHIALEFYKKNTEQLPLKEIRSLLNNVAENKEMASKISEEDFIFLINNANYDSFDARRCFCHLLEIGAWGKAKLFFTCKTNLWATSGRDLNVDKVWSLLSAVKGENLEAIDYLVKHGCEINVQNILFTLSETPLGLAVEKNNLPIVQYLVDKGAAINLNKHDSVYGTSDAIAIAFRNDYADIFDFLLNKGGRFYNTDKEYSMFDIILTAAEDKRKKIATYYLNPSFALKKKGIFF